MDDKTAAGFAATARSYGNRMQEALVGLEPRLKAAVLKDVGLAQRWGAIHPYFAGMIVGVVVGLVAPVVIHALFH